MAELSQVEAELGQLSDEADDLGVRAIVSDRPEDRMLGRDADRHRQALTRSRDALRNELAQLSTHQDELLDRLSSLAAASVGER